MKTIRSIYKREVKRKHDFFGADAVNGTTFMFFQIGDFQVKNVRMDVLKGTKYEEEVRNMRIRNPHYGNRLRYELYKDESKFSDLFPFHDVYERSKYYERYKNEPELLDVSEIIHCKTYIKEKYPVQFARIVQIFEELADAGSADAADCLVYLYDCNDDGCNQQERARRYKKAADKGSKNALIGLRYELRLCGYDSDEIISTLTPMIDSKASSLVFMWDLAVEAFYADLSCSLPTKKYDALVRRLVGEISRHKDEKHLLCEKHVFSQLDDFAYYIDHPNLLEEVRLSFDDNNYLEKDGGRNCFVGEDVDGEFLNELPGIYREKCWHLGVRCRGVRDRSFFYHRNNDCIKLMRIYSIDGDGNEDEAIFRHIVVDNTVMGGWCMLLFMQKYQGLHIDWLVDNADHIPFSIKPEDLGPCSGSDDDALDLFCPTSQLPYGKAAMLSEDKCRIDLVFNHKNSRWKFPRRVHATLLLVNNRFVGVNAEVVKTAKTGTNKARSKH